MNPFSETTVDTDGFKRLICGRSDEIQYIAKECIEGKSIALFGERRIGKTLLLWLVRDILNGDVRRYAHDLVDRKLKAWVENVALGQSGDVICKFVTLQAVEKLKTMEDVTKVFRGVFADLVDEDGRSLSELFELVSERVDRRVVIIVDEVEELLGDSFVGVDEVFAQLNASIQKCPKISFVMAGAEYWVQKCATERLRWNANLKSIYLAAPEKESFVEDFFGYASTLAAKKGQDWRKLGLSTVDAFGGRPLFSQDVASEFVSGKEQGALERVMNHQHALMEHIFKHPLEPHRTILRLLAHRSPLGPRQISRHIGKSLAESRAALESLVSMGTIERVGRGGKYRINGTMVARWGAEYLDPVPRPAFAWGLVRAAAVLIAVVAASVLWLYCHPRTAEFSMAVNPRRGFVSVAMPKTVEVGEEGDAQLWFVAGDAKLAKIAIIPLGSDIALRPESGRVWEVTQLQQGERASIGSAKFSVRSDLHGDEAIGAVSIDSGRRERQRLQWTVPLRDYAIKGFYLQLSGLCVLVAGMGTFWGSLMRGIAWIGSVYRGRRKVPSGGEQQE